MRIFEFETAKRGNMFLQMADRVPGRRGGAGISAVLGLIRSDARGRSTFSTNWPPKGNNIMQKL